jgi:phosphatidylethanolamine-binding protein (PEBP) family uncharacterized protein
MNQKTQFHHIHRVVADLCANEQRDKKRRKRTGMQEKAVQGKNRGRKTGKKKNRDIHLNKRKKMGRCHPNLQ